MPAHPEVAAEQRYLDEAYAALEAMRARTAGAVAVADNAAQEVDAAIARWHLEHRLRSLEADLPGLAFGRIDEESTGVAAGAAGDTWYIGRRHVEDAAGEPLVVDWRAGVATPFYRATAADPLGLDRRRRFLVTGRRIDDLFDEVFDDDASVHAAHGGVPDPLLAELERARTGEMRDIVATIQAEQDVIIRAPLGRCLVVQGGPGTGKTAVGLHRAAFLLYEHRQLLDEEGVLVIGPNPVFLRYIAQVLPSLGEAATRQTTIEGLLGGAGRVRGFDPPAVAALKGDRRMAGVLARALRQTVSPPEEDLIVATPWGGIRLDARDVRASIDEVAGRDVPHNVGRAALRAQVARAAEQAIAARRGEDAAPLGFADDLRRNRGFQRAIDRWWPQLAAAAVVRRLQSNRAALGRAAEGILDDAEQASLLRKPARRLDDEPWTAADLVLLDEADALLNGPARRYGHIVVDEAQDLTDLELRALARRCPSHSMTVLGDLAQATRPGAQRSWDEALACLGSPEGGSVEELELGYRVPAAIIEFANRLLPVAAPEVTPSRSVRAAGEPPTVLHVTADDMVPTVEKVVADLAGEWVSVGVVVPDGLAAFRDFGPGVTVVSPPDAKGLEFDAVVVLEPSRFSAGPEDQSGLRLLYVALTRAVQRLVLVHADPLPPPLLP